jgi:hypothetical protein
MTEINANYDEPWKEAIAEYFDRFLHFFFPEVYNLIIYNLINWLKPPISLGVLSADQFRLGSSATTADHRFFYNANNGGLFFDVDGNEVNSAVRIATLGTGLALTNADLFVI